MNATTPTQSAPTIIPESTATAAPIPTTLGTDLVRRLASAIAATPGVSLFVADHACWIGSSDDSAELRARRLVELGIAAGIQLPEPLLAELRDAGIEPRPLAADRWEEWSRRANWQRDVDLVGVLPAVAAPAETTRSESEQVSTPTTSVAAAAAAAEAAEARMTGEIF